jgi:hypothetical protein
LYLNKSHPVSLPSSLPELRIGEGL